MSRTYWETLVRVGVSFVSDSEIPTPNADLDDERVSTQVKTQLVTGEFGYITPSTGIASNQLRLVWLAIEDTDLTELIQGYIEDKSFIKLITTDLIEYTGKFISIKSTQLDGRTDYNVEAVFERMDV